MIAYLCFLITIKMYYYVSLKYLVAGMKILISVSISPDRAVCQPSSTNNSLAPVKRAKCKMSLAAVDNWELLGVTALPCS